ncbi:MAG: class I SAM-dependent methyltransferase [Bacteroidales bacterium]
MTIWQLYTFFSKIFRKERMRQFEVSFSLNPDTLVLDIGGSSFNWSFLDVSPKLVLLNLAAPKERPDNVTWIVADGRNLPFKDYAFDIAYSNSVIEHLGGSENQLQFAAELKRVGKRYYVQTPNKWFPVEPHLITPLIHWLPDKIQRRLLRNFTVWGLLTRPSPEKCEDLMRAVRLMDERELKELFPEAEIMKERLFGLTKSLMAIKT